MSSLRILPTNGFSLGLNTEKNVAELKQEEFRDLRDADFNRLGLIRKRRGF